MSLSYTQSNLTLSLNCTSTGLPPTNVTWSKDGVEISNGSYTFGQRVIDLNSTVYENTMVIVGDSEGDMVGFYQCIVQCYDDIGLLINSTSVEGKKECCHT